MTTTPKIRAERAGDEAAIRRVLTSAFPTDDESRLVDDLRRGGRLSVSLVALVGDEVVGQIAFSPVTVGLASGGLGLAPLAVLPPFQKRGIGAALVREGLAACSRSAAGFVVVLGEPGYYGRFGFLPASRFGLSDEYNGGDAFQVIEFLPGAIPEGGGLVRYAPEFSTFSG